MDIIDRYVDHDRVQLLGVKIDSLSVEQLLSGIQACIVEQRKTTISYVNVHALNLAVSIPWFRDFLNSSYLTFCDGFGVKLAASLTGQHIRYRFTPPDFIDLICDLAGRQNWKIFFLGAKPGVAQHAADKLKPRFPGIQVKTHHGYFDKTYDSGENRTIIADINRFHPHLLVVGFGMPMQEKWIMENMDSLEVNVAFLAGALFDYVSGEVKRAPRWVTNNGLEWLGRLVIEPRRLWKRYVIGNPLFFWRIFIYEVLGCQLPE